MENSTLFIFMMDVFHIYAATFDDAYVLSMVANVILLLLLHHYMLLSIFGYFVEDHTPYDGCCYCHV